MKNSTIWELGAKRMSVLPRNLEGLKQVMGTELFAVQSERHDEQCRSAAAWEAVLDKRHPRWRARIGNLEESPLVPAKHCFRYGGRMVSLDFYKKLNLALEILRYPVNRIVEIGAGWGQVGRILWQLARCDYTIIDIPETLCWSRIFLGAHEVPATLVKAEHFMQAAGVYDCLLNSSSFGEMDRAVAASYLRWFDSNRVKRCVLLNRLLNTYDPWREAQREQEAGWYFFADRTMGVEQWELEPDFTRIQGPEFSGHHRELFLVLGQGSMPQHDLQDVEAEAWITHRSSAACSRTTHILWPDKATLRLLLEMVRCHLTTKAVSLLLLYLESISLRHPFEETRLLLDMYRTLAGARHRLDRTSRLRLLTSYAARKWFARRVSPTWKLIDIQLTRLRAVMGKEKL